METFQTSNSKNTFLYLKVFVQKEPVFFAKSWVLLNGNSTIHETSGGIGSVPQGDGWYKLGNTIDFKGKRITIQTTLNTANYDIKYYLVEDDDNFSPILHSEKYTIKPIEVESSKGSHFVAKIINIS